MKYFKVSNTQAITNTCNNINWNEFPGCSRLKLGFRSGRVKCTLTPALLIPSPHTNSILLTSPSSHGWLSLTAAGNHQLTPEPMNVSKLQLSLHFRPITIESVYTANPWSQLITCSSKNLPIPQHPIFIQTYLYPHFILYTSLRVKANVRSFRLGKPSKIIKLDC